MFEGTKSDLKDDSDTQHKLVTEGKEMVKAQDVENLTKSIQAHAYIECSAKAGSNVQKVR